MPMPLRLFHVLLLAFVGTVSARADSPLPPIARGPSREAVPYTFDRADVKKLPGDYLTDYPACYVHASTGYRIAEDGTVEMTTHEVIRLNNRKGIDKIGEHRNITFVPAYEKLTLNEARVIKSDGTSVPVEPGRMQLRDVPVDYMVYDSSKELIVSFPALEVGDVIDIKWTTRSRHPEYDGQYFGRYSFGDPRFPILNEVFSIRTAKPIKWAYFNPALLANPKMKPEESADNGDRLYVWRDSKRLPVEKEQDMPDDEEMRPGIAFSTFTSWQQVGDYERKIRKECAECTVGIKEVVDRIVKEQAKPEAIVRELTHWVRTNVRYVSAGDKHDFTPHPASAVFKYRCGDCKDGAQLLAVMLKQAGIPSGYVSLSPKGDGQVMADVPSPWSTHAILHVAIDGKDHWIDTTAMYAGWDFLPPSDCDRVAYVVTENEISMMRTPVFTAADNKTVSLLKIKIDMEGDATCSRETEYFGQAAFEKRGKWIDTPRKERRKQIRKELQGEFPSATFGEEFDIDARTLMNFDRPVKLFTNFEVPGIVHGGETMHGFVQDWLTNTQLHIEFDDDREHDIELPDPFESRNRIEIDVPKGFTLKDVPEEETIESKWGKFTLKVTPEKNGRRWVIETTMKLEKTRVRKVDFEEFQTFLEDVKTANDIAINVSKPSDT